MAFRAEQFFPEVESLAEMRGKRESFGELFGELARETADLVRDEVTLAKREIQEKVRTVQSAMLVLVTGVVLALVAIMALSAAVIIALAERVGPWQSALIVGLVLGMIAGAFILLGALRFRRTKLRPEQTLQTLEENREWLKEIT
jgi:uncharacterized membrane protein YqjE